VAHSYFSLGFGSASGAGSVPSVGYRRCSTDDQDLEIRTDQLLTLGVPPKRIFTDSRLGVGGVRSLSGGAGCAPVLSGAGSAVHWRGATIVLVALLGLFGLGANPVLISLTVRFAGKAPTWGPP
jgi:hypothetical protein